MIVLDRRRFCVIRIHVVRWKKRFTAVNYRITGPGRTI